MCDKERKILHVDLDAFFVSVERVLNPQLRGKPVVVGGEPGLRGVVASASYEARAYGLCAGMPLTQAYRLCPQAIFLKGSFPRYREASERFMGILGDFTPYLEPVGIDGAYLDLTGFEPLYGPASETALRMKKRIENEIKITASIGIGTSKMVAKVASDMAKPDGLLEVPLGEERLFLAPLPIAKLPCVGRKTEKVLKGMGVTTIGELADLPASLLRGSFGILGEVIHRYALGIDDRKFEPPQAAKSISRETTFIEDTLDPPFLKATLRYLSERVGAELRRDRRRARCVTLKLRYADFDTVTRSRTLREATNVDQVIFDAGLELLERSLGQRRQRVRLIGIGVSSLVGDERQLSFWDTSPELWERLDRVIDRLRKKYSFTAIQRGQTLLLKEVFPTERGDYVLKTPALSR
ncbi:MAG: DNA polymerase IV [Dehalococcoidia bacterium]|nr:MAG: DNA polymerase IV [Dehalococcoidia bacterium]